MVEHPAVNRRVAGSSPACGAVRLTPPHTVAGWFFVWWGSLTALPEPPWFHPSSDVFVKRVSRTVPSDPERVAPEAPRVEGESRGPGFVSCTIGRVRSEKAAIPLYESYTMAAWVYILKLSSGALYVGTTRYLSSRVDAHFRGRACRTTTLDCPVRLMYSEKLDSFGEARRCENQIKRWSRAKKEALIRGDAEELRRLAKRRCR